MDSFAFINMDWRDGVLDHPGFNPVGFIALVIAIRIEGLAVFI